MDRGKLRLGIVVVVVLVLAPLLYVGASKFGTVSYGTPDTSVVDTETEETSGSERTVASHIETPSAVKAIYMSQCVVGTPSFREQLVDLVNETELNSIIIDVKDFTGKLGFQTDHPLLKDAVSDACGARDMEDFLTFLHEQDIYTIARITVFQDPYYTKTFPGSAVKRLDNGEVWQDYKGLAFVDVGYRPFWDYIVAISEEAYAVGFDELNFDYIRFPSDGNMKNVSYTHAGDALRQDALETFFAYVYDELKESDVVLSADLFGYTTTNADDLGIGQVLERALPYFDYVMPMVYPSHYNDGFIDLDNPAVHPYEVVKYSMESAVRRANKIDLARDSTSTSTDTVLLKKIAQKGHGNVNTLQLRPWLQDFDLGATYTPEMVRAQIQATYDAGLTSWALWDAGNTYTRAALNAE